MQGQGSKVLLIELLYPRRLSWATIYQASSLVTGWDGQRKTGNRPSPGERSVSCLEHLLSPGDIT